MAANKLLGSSRRAADTPRVETLPIAALRPNPQNPRKHSSRQLKRLAALIREVGFINPVIVDETMMILAGHGRVAAANQLGLTAIPVIIFDHLTPAQKRAYLIADNRIAEQAGWDRELLAVELGELIELLPAQGLDVTLTGFEVAEIDLLIADMATSPPAPEDVLPTMPSKVVSRSGDLWQLGKHRLLCGDARKSGNFAKLMNGAGQPRSFAIRPTISVSGTSAVAAKSNTRNSRSPPARCSRRSTVNFSRKPWETALTSRRPARCISRAQIGATSPI